MEGDGNDTLFVKLASCLKNQTSLAGCKIVFAMVSGSMAFNLNIATSDEDLFGVYMLSPFLSSFKRSVAGNVPTDYEVHELEEYLLLLEKGNPKVLNKMFFCFSQHKKVVEPLFAKHLVWRSPLFRNLEDAARKCVLTQHTLKQYLYCLIFCFLLFPCSLMLSGQTQKRKKEAKN
jgi:hypothetical protein